MLASRMLEVAIGLILVYFLFSLLSSAINEWIARFLGLRAVALRSSIEELLGNKAELIAEFHKNPLIAALTPEKAPLLRRKSDANRYPSYISAQTFVSALIAVSAGDEPPPDAAGLLDKIRENAPNGVKNLLLDVGGDIDKARARLESWFNHSMERFSGEYKRRAQVYLIVISLLVGVVFNIDSISIASRLYSDPALRAALATQANALVQSDKDLPTLQRDLDEELRKARGFGIPIGWDDSCMPPWSGSCQGSGKALLGILLTAIALSLGAPFWFDVLNKASNLRQTGARPEQKGD